MSALDPHSAKNLKQQLASKAFIDLLLEGELDAYLLTQKEALVVINTYKELIETDKMPLLLFNLGECYRYFSGYDASYETMAKIFYQEAAECPLRGNDEDKWIVEAQYMMGELSYYVALSDSNSGIKEADYSQAFFWFKKAAANHPVAQFMLGWCYYYGKGVDEDKNEGLKCIRESAKTGNPEVKRLLIRNNFHLFI